MAAGLMFCANWGIPVQMQLTERDETKPPPNSILKFFRIEKVQVIRAHRSELEQVGVHRDVVEHLDPVRHDPWDEEQSPLLK